MPDDGCAIDPESLHHGSGRMAEAHDRLMAALARWDAVLSSLGDVCGNDEPGRAVGSVHDRLRDFINTTACPKLDRGLASASQGLADMADNHTATDQRNQAAVWSMLPPGFLKPPGSGE